MRTKTVKLIARKNEKLDFILILANGRLYKEFAQLPSGLWVEAGLGHIPTRQFKTEDGAIKFAVEKFHEDMAAEAELQRKANQMFNSILAEALRPIRN